MRDDGPGGWAEVPVFQGRRYVIESPEVRSRLVPNRTGLWSRRTGTCSP